MVNTQMIWFLLIKMQVLRLTIEWAKRMRYGANTKEMIQWREGGKKEEFAAAEYVYIYVVVNDVTVSTLILEYFFLFI